MKDNLSIKVQMDAEHPDKVLDDLEARRKLTTTRTEAQKQIEACLVVLTEYCDKCAPMPVIELSILHKWLTRAKESLASADNPS